MVEIGSTQILAFRGPLPAQQWPPTRVSKRSRHTNIRRDIMDNNDKPESWPNGGLNPQNLGNI